MDLLDLYTNTVEGVYVTYRERFANKPDVKPEDMPSHEWKNRIYWHKHAADMIDLLDALKRVDGPRKWARDDHGHLIILPARHIHLRDQVKVTATGFTAYRVEMDGTA